MFHLPGRQFIKLCRIFFLIEMFNVFISFSQTIQMLAILKLHNQMREKYQHIIRSGIID